MFRAKQSDSYSTLSGDDYAIGRLEELSNDLDHCWNADSDDERRTRLSKVVKSHSIVKFGNKKLPDTSAIMSIGSASDCPNLLTGRCQAGSECYALKTENRYVSESAKGTDRQAQAVDARRRSEILFRCVSAVDIAHAIGKAAKRRRTDTRLIRFNEAGDVRSSNDVEKLDRIAGILSEEYDIEAYIYTASSHIDWPTVDNMIVNASNDQVPERVTDNRFKVVQNAPEDGFTCKYDCTKCVACGAEGGDDTIFVEMH